MFTFFPFRRTKAIEDAAKKQTKTIEERAENFWTHQKLKSISDSLSKYFLAAEARHELYKIKETEQEIKRWFNLQNIIRERIKWFSKV